MSGYILPKPDDGLKKKPTTLSPYSNFHYQYSFVECAYVPELFLYTLIDLSFLGESVSLL